MRASPDGVRVPAAIRWRGWLTNRGCGGGFETGLTKGLTRAYSTVRVDPAKFLLQLRIAHRMPISGYHGVYSLEIGEVDAVADSIIRSGMKVAAVEGAGFGLGGLMTIIPDLGILSAITMRTIEKLSLVYGFEFKTDEEIAELWVAAASAAGVDISRDFWKRSLEQIRAKSHSADCGEGQRGGCREVGGTLDSTGEFGDWRGIELLVRPGVGTAGEDAFPAAALVAEAASAAGVEGGGVEAAELPGCLRDELVLSTS